MNECFIVSIYILQDTERMEKVSRRINELETIHANVKLLSEMVSHFNPHSTTDAEKDMMKVPLNFSSIMAALTRGHCKLFLTRLSMSQFA